MKTLEDLLNNETKVYIEVTETRMPDGTVTPLSFVWEDEEKGPLFCDIVEIKEIRRTFSRKAGGYGVRYTVLFCISNEDPDALYMKYMFYERGIGRQDNRWFMERKSSL